MRQRAHCGRKLILLVAALATATATATATTASAGQRTNTVRAGAARFEVLTPTLIRLEYAQDGHFENRPTMTATRARLATPHFQTSRTEGLADDPYEPRSPSAYRLNSGPFNQTNLKLDVHKRSHAHDRAPNSD